MPTFQITIAEKGGQTKSLDFEKNEVTIGRVQGNDVVLPKGNISKRHSRIVVKDGKFIIIDMQSTNGTYVNGKKITTPQVVKSTDKIYIGDFTLQLAPVNGVGTSAPEIAPPPGRGRAQPDEIDLGGEESPDEDAAPRAGAPGLIDDNFDQEFEGTAEPEGKPGKAPAPAVVAGGPGKRSLARPDSGALDLDLSGGPAADQAVNERSAEEEPRKGGRSKAAVPAAPKPPPPSPASPAARPKPPASKTPVPAKPLPAADSEPPPQVIIPAPPPGITALPTALPSVPSLPSPGFAPLPAMPRMAPPAASRDEALATIQRMLIDELGLRSAPLSSLREQQANAEALARRRLEQMAGSGHIAPEENSEMLVMEAVEGVLNLDLIADLLGDETVHEIVLSHQGEVLAERDGQLGSVGRSAASEAESVALIRRLAAIAGLPQADKRSLVDARFRDGSRLVATLPPLSFRGPTMSLRKATREAFTFEALGQHGTLSSQMTRFIEHCIRYRKGVLLSLGTGVGGSATLNALAALVPSDERLLAIEGGVELHLLHGNVTSLEPNAEVGLATLVQHAVAVQPERTLIGSLSGPGTKEAILAAGGPLEGTLACCTALSPADALEQLARACEGMEPDVARKTVARAFPVVLQEERFADGSRRITRVAEYHVDGETVSVEDVFLFEVEGVDESGLITGSFKATGYIPRFLEELQDRGLEVDLAIFQA